MQEYTRQLGDCLMELQQDSSSPILKQLQTWAAEVESLFVSLVLNSPGRLKELSEAKMDEGKLCPPERPPNFYSNLLVCVPVLGSDRFAMSNNS